MRRELKACYYSNNSNYVYSSGISWGENWKCRRRGWLWPFRHSESHEERIERPHFHNVALQDLVRISWGENWKRATKRTVIGVTNRESHEERIESLKATSFFSSPSSSWISWGENWKSFALSTMPQPKEQNLMRRELKDGGHRPQHLPSRCRNLMRRELKGPACQRRSRTPRRGNLMRRELKACKLRQVYVALDHVESHEERIESSSFPKLWGRHVPARISWGENWKRRSRRTAPSRPCLRESHEERIERSTRRVPWGAAPRRTESHEERIESQPYRVDVAFGPSQESHEERIERCTRSWSCIRGTSPESHEERIERTVSR